MTTLHSSASDNIVIRALSSVELAELGINRDNGGVDVLP